MDHLLYFRTTPLRSALGFNKSKDQRADRALDDPGWFPSRMSRLSRAGGSNRFAGPDTRPGS